MQIAVNYGSFHSKMLLAFYHHSRKMLFIKLFSLISPLSLIPASLPVSYSHYIFSFISLLISLFVFPSPSNFCTCLCSATSLVSGSLSVAAVKSIKTGRSTCTTTVLHLVHWPVVSLIPAALLLR